MGKKNSGRGRGQSQATGPAAPAPEQPQATGTCDGTVVDVVAAGLAAIGGDAPSEVTAAPAAETSTIVAPAPADDAGQDGAGVLIECPLRHTGGYALRNIGYLPSKTSQMFRDLADGLQAAGARLASTGKIVSDSRDAMIWIGEQLEAGRDQ